MGGLTTAIGYGLSGANLLNEANKSNKELKQMQKNYQYNYAKKKNLLDEQLASRKASLSAMGLGSSKSALAAQQREIKEGYDDLKNNAENFEYSYQQKLEEKNKNLIDGLYGNIIDATTKMIK